MFKHKWFRRGGRFLLYWLKYLFYYVEVYCVILKEEMKLNWTIVRINKLIIVIKLKHYNLKWKRLKVIEKNRKS